MRPLLLLSLVALFAATGASAQEAPICVCVPESGQPAADVLGSEDAWGNPTFIGGITNRGPNSGSVW